MSRFPFGMAVFVLFLFGQAGIVFASASDDGSPVTGTVSFRGPLPVAETMLVTADAEVCGKEVLIQTVQVNERTLGLRHVVVSIKGLPSSTHDDVVPTRIIVNAKCSFVPRVSAGRIGDTLEIHNSDPILHNTHIMLGGKTFLNVAQLPGSRPIPKTLQRAGLHVIRCDKHTFRTGALQVFDHPYFAVTDEFGNFQLPQLPVGTYTMVVWHETLGSLEQEITVPSKGPLTINVDFPSDRGLSQS